MTSVPRSLDRGWRRGGIRLLHIAAVAAALPLLLLAAWYAWTGVDTYAIHFCGWPATLSCERGEAMWYLVPAAVSAAAIVAGIGLVGGVTSRGLWGAWLLAAWTLGLAVRLMFVLRPTEFGPDLLVTETVYMAIGVGLVWLSLVQLLPARRRLITWLGVLAMVTLVTLAALLPGALRSAGG